MSKNASSKVFKFLGIAAVLILIVAFFIYRAGAPGFNPEEEIDVPEITQESVIDFSKAPEYIGQRYWIKGEIDHVFVSDNNNYFLNFCPDFRDCPFAGVIFADKVHRFENIKEWKGQVVYIYGSVSTYEGRAQIIIESPAQVKVDFE